MTFEKLDSQSLLARESVTWAHHPTTRNLRNLARNLGLAWWLLRSYRPDLVVSSGAGVAFPFFLVARLFGRKTVYVEVYDRIDSATMTGRLCYPLSNLFLLQWEEQRHIYPKGIVIGSLSRKSPDPRLLLAWGRCFRPQAASAGSRVTLWPRRSSWRTSRLAWAVEVSRLRR